MTAPLAGIKVVEVASWLAAPSCAALMADMGAEVIKVEPPGGDTYRRMYSAMLGKISVVVLAEWPIQRMGDWCSTMRPPSPWGFVWALKFAWCPHDRSGPASSGRLTEGRMPGVVRV